MSRSLITYHDEARASPAWCWSLHVDPIGGGNVEADGPQKNRTLGFADSSICTVPLRDPTAFPMQAPREVVVGISNPGSSSAGLNPRIGA